MAALDRPLLWWRLAAWSLALIPLIEVAWRVATARLGPNPVEFLEHHLGEWALRLLLLTLAMTPLARWSARNEFIRIRRLLGLWSFTYVCLHLLTYLTFDLTFSLPQLTQDLVKRSYITVGFAAFLMLLPLAVTSTRRWQQRLRRRWKALHRLIYPAALCGVLHYLWLVKSDLRAPLIYLAVLTLLMVVRIPWRILRARLISDPVS